MQDYAESEYVLNHMKLLYKFYYRLFYQLHYWNAQFV